MFYFWRDRIAEKALSLRARQPGRRKRRKIEEEGKGNEYALCTSSEPHISSTLTDAYPHNNPKEWWGWSITDEKMGLWEIKNLAQTLTSRQKEQQQDLNSLLLTHQEIFHCSKVVKTKWDNTHKRYWRLREYYDGNAKTWQLMFPKNIWVSLEVSQLPSVSWTMAWKWLCNTGLWGCSRSPPSRMAAAAPLNKASPFRGSCSEGVTKMCVFFPFFPFKYLHSHGFPKLLLTSFHIISTLLAQ